MGSINFVEFKAAPTAKEAFNQLVEEYEYYYGHDPYNGTISTCDLDTSMPPVKLADTWSEDIRSLVTKHVEKHDFGTKWYATPIDCGKCKEGHMWAFYGLAAI